MAEELTIMGHAVKTLTFINYDPDWHEFMSSLNGKNPTSRAIKNNPRVLMQLYRSLGWPENLESLKNDKGESVQEIVHTKVARKILQMYSDAATKGEVLRTGSKRKKTAVDRTRATSSAAAKISSSSLLPLTLRPCPATAGPFSAPETLVPKPLKQKQPPPRPQQAGFGDLSPAPSMHKPAPYEDQVTAIRESLIDISDAEEQGAQQREREGGGDSEQEQEQDQRWSTNFNIPGSFLHRDLSTTPPPRSQSSVSLTSAGETDIDKRGQKVARELAEEKKKTRRLNKEAEEAEEAEHNIGKVARQMLRKEREAKKREKKEKQEELERYYKELEDIKEKNKVREKVITMSKDPGFRKSRANSIVASSRAASTSRSRNLSTAPNGIRSRSRSQSRPHSQVLYTDEEDLDDGSYTETEGTSSERLQIDTETSDSLDDFWHPSKEHRLKHEVEDTSGTDVPHKSSRPSLSRKPQKSAFASASTSRPRSRSRSRSRCHSRARTRSPSSATTPTPKSRHSSEHHSRLSESSTRSSLKKKIKDDTGDKHGVSRHSVKRPDRVYLESLPMHQRVEATEKGLLKSQLAAEETQRLLAEMAADSKRERREKEKEKEKEKRKGKHHK
ncbi:hypothetical protein BKA61DRAFT_682689 [Leptodontidium sp. MPI-SDFR-AT-0119]|nr:hypothetical protein BKA61DRAFT_682689 [Leptodontidium sp. MPI-SDFR-AT-0119]